VWLWGSIASMSGLAGFWVSLLRVRDLVRARPRAGPDIAGLLDLVQLAAGSTSLALAGARGFVGLCLSSSSTSCRLALARAHTRVLIRACASKGRPGVRWRVVRVVRVVHGDLRLAVMARLSADELVRAVGDLNFELDMLVKMPFRIGRFETEDMATRNACTDAIMLHARNLIKFLFAVERQSYSQENFVSGWKPTGDAAERLKDVLPVLHQHFAHLSPQRLKPELPRKQFRQYQDRLQYDILEVMSDFVQVARSQESSVAWENSYVLVETSRPVPARARGFVLAGVPVGHRRSARVRWAKGIRATRIRFHLDSWSGVGRSKF